MKELVAPFDDIPCHLRWKEERRSRAQNTRNDIGRRGLHCDCTNWELRRRSLFRPECKRKKESSLQFAHRSLSRNLLAAAKMSPPPLPHLQCRRRIVKVHHQILKTPREGVKQREGEVAEMQQDFKPCSLSLPPLPMQAACVSLSPCCYLLPLLRVRDKSLFLGKHAVGRLTHSLAQRRTEESHIHEESKYEKSFQEPQSLATGWSQGLTCYSGLM